MLGDLGGFSHLLPPSLSCLAARNHPFGIGLNPCLVFSSEGEPVACFVAAWVDPTHVPFSRAQLIHNKPGADHLLKLKMY